MNNFSKISLAALLLATTIFSSCKKEYESIESIDNTTISSYISKNNLASAMIADPNKSGFYYQVTATGTGNTFKNTDSVLYNLTVKSLVSGSTYLQSPLLSNLSTFVGYTSSFYNSSLQSQTNTGLYDIPAIRTAIQALKPGGTARVLLPSYLAFGRNGAGNIPPNEVIDLEITTYPYTSQASFDDYRITQYLTSKGLNATKDPSGIYYIVNTVGTGDVINSEESTVVTKYTGRLLDGTVFDSSSEGVSFLLTDVIPAWTKIIPKFKTGTKFRMFVPSGYGYGTRGTGSILPNVVLDFDIEIVSVTN